MTSSHTSTNTEEAPEQSMAPRGESRLHHPDSDAFHKFMGSGWGLRITKEIECCGAANYLPQRAVKAGEPLAGEHLAIPMDTYKVRNNGYTYRFRAYSAFAHLSGLRGEREPDSILVLGPKENGSHETVLYFKPRTPRFAQEFYSDLRYRESWVNARPSLEEVHQEMGLRCAHVDALPGTLAKDAGRVKLRIVREVDVSIEAMISGIREQAGLPFGEEAGNAGRVFEKRLSETRLHKDVFELAEFARAVEVTHAGLEDIVRVLPRAAGHRRGKRIVEGAFGAVAREGGNGLGYGTITASGNHANTFHWIDNGGPVNEGDLVLVDAGVEVDSLYAVDIIRTLPVNDRFIEVQARVHQAVLDACEVALARANEPGTRFRDVRDAAMPVIATHLRELGLLPINVEESLSPTGQQHHRWIPHDTSHHLGFDVRDCAQVRRKMYQDASLGPGITSTIGSDLYFRADDEAIPTKCHSVSVRIEDDVVANEDGSVTRIFEDTPCMIDGVKTWIARAQGR